MTKISLDPKALQAAVDAGQQVWQDWPVPIDISNVGTVRYAARKAEIGSYLARTRSADTHAIEAVEAPFRELVANLRQQISALITDKANLTADILRLTQDRQEAQQATARYKRALNASPPGCPFDRATVDLSEDEPCPVCGMTGKGTSEDLCIRPPGFPAANA